MSIIFVLIPLAIIIVSIAIGVFFWAVKSNQFDDLERQGYSILFDDDIKKNGANDNADKANDTASDVSLEQSVDVPVETRSTTPLDDVTDNVTITPKNKTVQSKVSRESDD
jgi:cbb3-type cytochrome oxidase maturation protein